MEVIKLNKDNFKEKINSKEGILVDFFATWCGPCKVMGPIIEEIAKSNNFAVGKIDVDEAEDLASEYGIMSIPCIIYFKEGKEVNRSVGIADKDTLVNMVKSNEEE